VAGKEKVIVLKVKPLLPLLFHKIKFIKMKKYLFSKVLSG
jgi:hypothetical protein